MIQNFKNPEFLQLFTNTVRLLGRPPLELENAPSSVEVTLRGQQQGRRLMLHLVNFTGEMTRPITRVLPLTNVRITVAGAAQFSKARTLFAPQSLPVRRTANGALQVTLPRAGEYEVVVFEK
jgi:hypothetical protein